MKLPNYVALCIEQLEKNGHSAFVVGGAVRDYLLGMTPYDFDVTTSASPEEILAAFKDFRTIPTGIAHGTITVLFENEGKFSPIEVTTHRVDGAYTDARHPDRVSFSNRLDDDLSRRDFTINAMAYNEKCGIVDRFGGRGDLKKRLIRCVGEPNLRFSEDALRILRAYRFASQINFEIEEKTLVATKNCAHLLSKIARERIAVELKRMISYSGAEYSLKKMIENGVWQAIFPSFADPSEKIIEELKHLPFDAGGSENAQKIRTYCGLSALILDYEKESREPFLTSLRLSNDEKKLVLRLAKVSEFKFPDKDCAEISARRFLHLYDDILPYATNTLLLLEKIGEGSADAEGFVRLVRREKEAKRCLKIADLALSGNDLLPICGGEHRLLGKLLQKLLEHVIENPEANEYDALIKLAKDIVSSF